MDPSGCAACVRVCICVSVYVYAYGWVFSAPFYQVRQALAYKIRFLVLSLLTILTNYRPFTITSGAHFQKID